MPPLFLELIVQIQKSGNVALDKAEQNLAQSIKILNELGGTK